MDVKNYDRPQTADPRDRLFRLIALLQLIPRYPKRISTAELKTKLQAQGFEIHTRTLQRDLNEKLSVEFPLLCEEEGKAYYWSFSNEAPRWNFPTLDMPIALAFLLAESHLEKLVPYGILELLQPYFEHARQQLEQLEHLPPSRWAKCVRAVPNGKTLLPAAINNSVWNTVSSALMKQQCISVTYLSRAKQQPSEFVLHPAGLVARHSQSYLLACVEGYSDVRQFALHRIQQAESLEKQAITPADFNVDHYIHGSLNTPEHSQNITLVADVSPQIAWLLNETPLSTEQRLEAIESSDWQRLHAKVLDDNETLWWVFGLGENIRVQEPEAWVDKILDRVNELRKLYSIN